MAPVLEPMVGRYLRVEIEGVPHRIYFEEAGQGTPLLCLHTAGADSRQFRHVLNDPAIPSRYRVIAFDMPYHGRSNPPDLWWLRRYLLTTGSYLACIRAVWTALGLERPVVILAELGDKHLEDLRDYLYVGGSRARNHLVVLAAEPVARELRAITGVTGP